MRIAADMTSRGDSTPTAARQEASMDSMHGRVRMCVRCCTAARFDMAASLCSSNCVLLIHSKETVSSHDTLE